jgi:hypothetical protein
MLRCCRSVLSNYNEDQPSTSEVFVFFVINSSFRFRISTVKYTQIQYTYDTISTLLIVNFESSIVG